MPEEKKGEELLTVSASPHVRDPDSTALIMWTVVIALIPPGAVGLYAFGWRVLVVAAASVLSALVTELLCLRLRGKKPSISDGSAFVTGVLVAYILPPNVGWYVPVAGSAFAIAFGKQIFGGLGCNFFNPALLGRAFVQFAFPAQVNLARWPVLPPRGMLAIFAGDVAGADAVTGATALNLLKQNPALDWAGIVPEADSFRFGIAELFLGHVPGCIGETSALALLLGASFLIYYRLIDWRLPFAYIASAALFLWLLPPRGGAALPGGVYARVGIAVVVCIALAAAAAYGFRKTRIRLPVRLASGLGLGAGLFAGAGLGGWAWGIPGAVLGLGAGLGGGVLACRYGVDRGARGVVGTLSALFFALAVFGACAFGGRGESAEALKLGRLLAHLFGGGLFLGAFFMITDMVSRPMTSLGRVIMGVGAGILVSLIRNYGAYPEGVCYSILIMNAAVPLIDRFTVPRVFGAREKK